MAGFPVLRALSVVLFAYVFVTLFLGSRAQNWLQDVFHHNDRVFNQLEEDHTRRLGAQELKFPTVYALGDIHGDFNNAIEVLSFAGLVSDDEERHWTGGNSILVQTGDIVDRGPDTRKIFAWMNTLAAEAEQVGGAVIRLLGNHEFMNARGDWRYVHPGDIESYPEPSIQHRTKDWQAHGEIGSLLLSSYNITYFEKQTRSHFMHAGLSRHWAKHESEINDLGNRLLELFMARESIPNKYMTFWQSDGPMWYRGHANLPDEAACKNVKEILRIIDADRVIMGHTPQLPGIRQRCDGKIILIDTGLSSAYSGAKAILRLEQDEEYVVASAVYADRAELLSKTKKGQL
ncbi:phosphoprotein phosphatase [Schizosaccharomyces japonicus yFS275]|uniref:Phosphoprotein phosphatase n=1 Tax=Schizosaccharomyces japonicus (strain yFS275 / FY16936) TaxID=402676 RepID=B6JXJ0_SCHJY|nr:phosphoprotein phosphatase [Schizosaccharomyces japonicus yFS275]EEB05134.1 phosphoprotein phosphatase [Schizosaccharomyces japonicus yFS275]